MNIGKDFHSPEHSAALVFVSPFQQKIERGTWLLNHACRKLFQSSTVRHKPWRSVWIETNSATMGPDFISAKKNHCSEWIFNLNKSHPCVALSFPDMLTVSALTDKSIYFIIFLSNKTRKKQFFYDAISLRSFQSKRLCEVSRWGMKSK